MSEQRDYSLHDAFGQSVVGLSLTQKAFQEVEGLFKFLGGTTPQFLFDLTKNAHAAIDTYIDRSEEDKDCLKALTVIELGHDIAGGVFLFDDMARYSTLYSPQFSAMAFDLMRGNNTQYTVQADMALTFASLQQQLAAFRDPQNIVEIDIEDTAATYAVMLNLENHPFANTAPRLVEKIKNLSDQVIQAIRGVSQQGLKNDVVLKP